MKIRIAALLALIAVPAQAQTALRTDLKGYTVGAEVGPDTLRACKASVYSHTCPADADTEISVNTTSHLNPNVIWRVGHRFGYAGEVSKLLESISDSYALKKPSRRRASDKRVIYLWKRSDGTHFELVGNDQAYYLSIENKALADAVAKSGRDKTKSVAPPKF